PVRVRQGSPLPARSVGENPRGDGKDVPLMPLDTTVEVDTPEQVRFRFQVAGPGRRALAYLIDAVIRGVIVAGGAIVVSLVGGHEGGGYASGFILLLLFAVE